MRDIPEEITTAGITISEIVSVTWDDAFTFETAPAFEVSTQYSSRTVEHNKLTNSDLATLGELTNVD